MLARAAVILAIAAAFAALSTASWRAVAGRVRASGPRLPFLPSSGGAATPDADAGSGSGMGSPALVLEVPPPFEWGDAPEAPPRPSPAVAPASWAPPDWPMDPPVKIAGLTYPTIQAAVAAAEEGGTIVLPRGVYSRPIAIRGRHDLWLEGGPALVLVPSNRGAVIAIEDSQRIGLRDVFVRHDAPPGACPSAVAIRVARSSQVQLSRVFLGGCARASLAADQVSGLSVSDSVFEESGEIAFSGDRLQGDVVLARSALSSRGAAARLSGSGRLLLLSTRLAPAPGRDALALSGRFEGVIRENVLLGPLQMAGGAPPSLAGENVVVKVEPGHPVLGPELRGVDLGWRPPMDFAGAGLDAFSPEVQKLKPGPDASLVGRSVLLCGRGRPRAFHSLPGGPPMDLLLPACEEVAPGSRDDGVLLHQVVEQREGWLKVRYDVRGEGRRGTAWMESADLGSACTVEVAGLSLLTGLFQPAVKGVKEGKLQLEGRRTGCGTSVMEEEVPLPPAAAPRWQSAEVRCAHRAPACEG
ncbi:MAG TPA: hypothetical protein VFB81_02195 [Myxococcales bacterium]|nr:hypothetical protein [Myxococcales bacterium]